MKSQIFCNLQTPVPFILMVACIILFGCGGDGGEPSSNIVETGATLQGNIKSVSVTSMQIADVGNIKVSIGDLEATTDEEGNVMIQNLPIGDQVIQFEGNGFSNFYDLIDIEEKETFVLRDIEINDDQVNTEHTGIWIGTAGSTDDGSEGQVAFTMVIAANGNEITGTGILIGSPDNSVWSVEGTENGINIEGEFELISSESECATGGTFTGTFTGNTIDADFIEVDPPEGCGDPESGTFYLEKQ